MIKKMGWFIRMITFGWAAAITLYPLGIYIKEEYLDDKDILHHEIGHWFQQITIGYLFYPIYLLEWIIKLPLYGRKAYKNLSFERETREHLGDWTYWTNRKHLAWVKYI